MRNIGFKESLTVEFKSDRNMLSDTDIIDVVVAFANTNGGDLYLGVEDDGSVSGLNKSRGDQTQLAAVIANKTVPPVAVSTSCSVKRGVSILVTPSALSSDPGPRGTRSGRRREPSAARGSGSPRGPCRR